MPCRYVNKLNILMYVLTVFSAVSSNYSISVGHVCTNFIGGFRCHCPSGFQLNQHGSCEDVDECSRFAKTDALPLLHFFFFLRQPFEKKIYLPHSRADGTGGAGRARNS